MHRWMRQFHTPSTLLAEQVQSLRKTKNEYFQKMVDEATTQNIWTYWKWTTKTTTYTSPPLDQGENHPPVITHAQKCDTLRTHLFPEPLQLENEPEPDLNEDPEDLEYHSITKREVKDVVFTAVQLNAPGISGLTGRAWRWGWEILEDAMFNLVRLCADSGYHPKAWRTSIAMALQKPNRDYSKPRSYRLIQLLEVLGKTLERIQARRLLYLAAKYKLFPSTQYGGISGRSAQDAMMAISHDIEAAWNHDRAVTMLMFDITGFFDTIPHSYLLDTLRKFHIPIPVVKWVKSFLQGRKAAICLDGKRDELKEVQMGVLQGSCASPILAAYFTAPLGDLIKQGFESTIQQDPELSSALNPLRNSLAPLTLYVDNRSIAASARDWITASKMVEIGFREAHQWLTEED